MADDPSPDWRLLAPHRPLSPGDDAYVARPTSGGEAIATWVVAGGSTVLVGGPTGVGKSTELAQAAQALTSTRVACLVQVDRMTNIHRLVADTLLYLLARKLVEYATRRLQLPISAELVAAIGPLEAEDMRAGAPTLHASGVSAARTAIQEVARASQPGRVALLVDGLEKLLPGPGTREIFDALAQLPESVDLIVVIPWHAAFGGGTESILRGGEHLHRVMALVTEGEGAAAAAEFLVTMLARRWPGIDALGELPLPLLNMAIKKSGGIPRVFLQLMADAGTYARVKRGAPWPDDSDLRDAIVDQQDSFRRALLPGDTRAIGDAAGTDGRELDLERRVRLLAQGILIERARGSNVVLAAHPLIVPMLPP